jgi:hypothetical protein
MRSARAILVAAVTATRLRSGRRRLRQHRSAPAGRIPDSGTGRPLPRAESAVALRDQHEATPWDQHAATP